MSAVILWESIIMDSLKLVQISYQLYQVAQTNDSAEFCEGARVQCKTHCYFHNCLYSLEAAGCKLMAQFTPFCICLSLIIQFLPQQDLHPSSSQIIASRRYDQHKHVRELRLIINYVMLHVILCLGSYTRYLGGIIRASL